MIHADVRQCQWQTNGANSCPKKKIQLETVWNQDRPIEASIPMLAASKGIWKMLETKKENVAISRIKQRNPETS